MIRNENSFRLKILNRQSLIFWKHTWNQPLKIISVFNILRDFNRNVFDYLSKVLLHSFRFHFGHSLWNLNLLSLFSNYLIYFWHQDLKNANSKIPNIYLKYIQIYDSLLLLILLIVDYLWRPLVLVFIFLSWKS